MEQNFGERLAKLRKAKGLTQEDVGEKLQISAQAVSKWENDTTLPDPLMLKQLADIYGVTLNQIYGIEEKETVSISKNRDINKMILKILVDSADGDKVRVNLPMAIVKICLDSGMSISQFNGNDALKNIDFKQILDLVEQGLMGNLVDVTSSKGDIVHIVVE